MVFYDFPLVTNYGIPERLVHAIEIMYHNTKAQVLTND